MTIEELQAIMEYLRGRVHLLPKEASNQIAIEFVTPTETEMIEVGLSRKGTNRILQVPWWDEMAEDIVDTPEMCDPDDPAEQVLEYARDVVSEYIRKRFPLNPD